MAIAIICLLQPIELFHFVYSCFDATHTLPDLKVGELYGKVQEGVKSGEWGRFFMLNITTEQKASLLWAVNAGRFVQTIGLFLLGFLFSRNNLFVDSKENTKFWVKLSLISTLAFGALYPLKVQWFDNAPTDIIKSSIGTAPDMWQKLSLTFVIISSFIIAYYNSSFANWTKKLSA